VAAQKLPRPGGGPLLGRRHETATATLEILGDVIKKYPRDEGGPRKPRKRKAAAGPVMPAAQTPDHQELETPES